MKTILLAIAAISILGLFYATSHSSVEESSDENLITRWENFQIQMGKVYLTQEEEIYRLSVFKENLQQIENHNKFSGQKWTMGVTSFTDLTESEFLSQYTMPSSSLPARRNSTESKVNSKFLKQSGSINWVAQGMTPPVLNQGSCNAGYAFATVEAVESAYAIIRNVNVSLSVEQVVQCSQSYQNNGCTGGQVQHSLEYVQNNGLCTSTQYPWVSGNGQTGSCNTNLAQSCKTQYTITGDNSIDGCENLSQYLQDQPITACLESSPSLQNYNGGVFDGSDCTTGQNVQCMLAVGIVNGDWYLQNSWGTTWGDQGYIYVASGNTCAVCNFNQQAELNRN